MDFSNRHTNKFVYACDLERVLGGVFACHEGIAGAGVSGVDTRSVYQAGEHNNTAVVNGVNVAIFDCTGGNVDSELLLRKSLKNIVIPDSDPESEICACANTNALCHCEERSDVAIHSCHAELVSASYQRGMDKFSVNTFLNQICAFITGKILNIPEPFEYPPSTLQNDTKGMASADCPCHCERSEAIQENCHAELVSASYQREMDKFSVNHDNGIFPPVQSKIASLRNGGIVMLRLPKPCTSASLFRLHIGSRDGGVK